MTRIHAGLETVLRAWEDYWFLEDLLYKALTALGVQPPYKRENAVASSRAFRSYLHQLDTSSSLATTELSRFAPPPRMMLPSSLVGLHAALATWCKHGRIVYDLSVATQKKLSTISLGDRSWTDILLPQTAFAVTLEQPLTTPRPGDRFDLILVGPYSASSIYKQAPHDFRVNELRAFRSSVAEYRPLPPRTRKVLQDYLRQQRFKQLANELDELIAHVGKIASLVLIVGPEATAQPIATSHAGRTQQPASLGASLVQELVARLCLYLVDSPSAAIVQTPTSGSTSSTNLVEKAVVHAVT